jgi:hypothetical protein
MCQGHSSAGEAQSPVFLVAAGVSDIPESRSTANSFDWETWYECKVFRADVEKLIGESR